MKPYAFLILMLIPFLFAGCGADDIDEPAPVKFLSADPPAQSLNPPVYGNLWYSSKITLTFDGNPKNIRVSHGNIAYGDKIIVVTGPFPEGLLILKITWDDGSEQLVYKVTTPD